MSKRRTRKQKEKVKHPFIINQTFLSGKKNKAKISSEKVSVKRQTSLEPTSAESIYLEMKTSNLSGQFTDLASIKRDILKSLSLASLILASELVLYLIWH